MPNSKGRGAELRTSRFHESKEFLEDYTCRFFRIFAFGEGQAVREVGRSQHVGKPRPSLTDCLRYLRETDLQEVKKHCISQWMLRTLHLFPRCRRDVPPPLSVSPSQHPLPSYLSCALLFRVHKQKWFTSSKVPFAKVNGKIRYHSFIGLFILYIAFSTLNANYSAIFIYLFLKN